MIPRHKTQMEQAALNGDLKLMMQLSSMYSNWKNVSVTANAAKSGSLECLRWAHENGCPWNDQTTTQAKLNGHLECFQYAVRHGCPVRV